jgi:hypothetical protein
MQNHPKPDLKLILRPKEDFRDIFQPGLPGWPGPCNQPLRNVTISLHALLVLSGWTNVCYLNTGQEMPWAMDACLGW